MEGRRDHIYQAAMFDPLTAATMPLDKIVEMCDELIAAHGCITDGGYLPQLDGIKTLVPCSGKEFEPVDARELRSAWRRRVIAGRKDYISKWKVIGPFPAGNENRRGLDVKTSVDDAFATAIAGQIDLSARHSIGSRKVHWKPVAADECGKIDLESVLGAVDWAVAYADAEFHADEARDVIFRIGSDDGIKVWLNGTLVHWHEVGRGYRADSDFATGRIRAGINRIFVKIDNYTGGWGFGVAITEA
jgi:hypothetical protein